MSMSIWTQGTIAFAAGRCRSGALCCNARGQSRPWLWRSAVLTRDGLCFSSDAGVVCSPRLQHAGRDSPGQHRAAVGCCVLSQSCSPLALSAVRETTSLLACWRAERAQSMHWVLNCHTWFLQGGPGATCPRLGPSAALTMGLREALHEVVGHLIDLHGQLPRGGDHQRPCAIAGHELGAVQQLQAGDEEGQGLARPCSKRCRSLADMCLHFLCSTQNACSSQASAQVSIDCKQLRARHLRRAGLQ